MDKLDNKLNKFFSRIQFLSPWLIRLGLGIAFSIHGLSKFPLPPEVLMDYFGFSAFFASFTLRPFIKSELINVPSSVIAFL